MSEEIIDRNKKPSKPSNPRVTYTSGEDYTSYPTWRGREEYVDSKCNIKQSNRKKK
jgi:hypothetical protein